MKKKRIILISAIVVAAALAIYFSFFYAQKCQNYSCFQSAMQSCIKKSYINEESEASWLYAIKGKTQSECSIEVKLLQAKQGELQINRLQGYTMLCSYSLGTSAYPEKDLSKCHGRLKEELQTIIITKLHTYIIENIGEFRGNLTSA